MLFLLAFTAGRAVLYQARIYNNTGRDLTLTTAERTHPFAAETSWKGFYLARDGIRVSGAEQRWLYDQQLVPNRFLSGWSSKRTLNLQLQGDGAMYALHPRDVPPVRELPLQPPRWPMRPLPPGSPTRAQRIAAEQAAATHRGRRSPGLSPPAVVAQGYYPEVVALLRAQVPEQLPQVGDATRAVLNSSDPLMTGWYKMSGDYGQYFFEWKLPDGSRVVADYTGGLFEPRPGQVDVRLSLQP
jgi:hypothetical protein